MTTAPVQLTSLRHAEPVMGTVVSFDVRGGRTATLEAAVADAVRWLHRVDAVFSTYRPDSEISRLRRGEITLAQCSADVEEIFGLCDEIGRVSHGYFSAWAGGLLDPTGAVKGWAVKRASDLLVAAGSRAHAVNGGGDVQTAGEPEPGRPWRVGVANPLHPGTFATVVEVRGLAVATSGTAERGPHILNPFTGRPAADLVSLTVIGPDLTRADAYATAGFAMGQAARGWLEDLPGYDGFAVSADETGWATSGYRGSTAR